MKASVAVRGVGVQVTSQRGMGGVKSRRTFLSSVRTWAVLPLTKEAFRYWLDSKENLEKVCRV